MICSICCKLCTKVLYWSCCFFFCFGRLNRAFRFTRFTQPVIFKWCGVSVPQPLPTNKFIRLCFTMVPLQSLPRQPLRLSIGLLLIYTLMIQTSRLKNNLQTNISSETLETCFGFQFYGIFNRTASQLKQFINP